MDENPFEGQILLDKVPPEVWEMMRGKVIKAVVPEFWSKEEKWDGHKALRFEFADGSYLRVTSYLSYTSGYLCANFYEKGE